MLIQINMKGLSHGPIVFDKIFERLPFGVVSLRISRGIQNVVRFPLLFVSRNFSNFKNLFALVINMKMRDLRTFSSNLAGLGSKFLFKMNHVVCSNLWWKFNTNCILLD